MQHSGELWQEFRDNGEPIPGAGFAKTEFAFGKKICATVHIWLWRRTAEGVKVLIQKRAMTVDDLPGMWDISAAGHVNLGESPVEAVIREAREEINYKISPEKLVFVMTLPTRFDRSKYETYRHVYLYQVDENAKFNFNDGEVETVEWKSFAELLAMVEGGEMATKEPEYWQILFDRLEKISRREEK